MNKLTETLQERDDEIKANKRTIKEIQVYSVHITINMINDSMFQVESDRLSEDLKEEKKKNEMLSQKHFNQMQAEKALKTERDDLSLLIKAKTSKLEESNQVSICNEHKIYFDQNGVNKAIG